MRSIVTATVPDGDFTAPHEFNREVGNLAKTLGSLDHDNIRANALTTDKLELGALQGIRVTGYETGSVTVTVDATRTDIFPVPKADGSPWIETVPTGDGVLSVTFSGEWQANDGLTQQYLWCGIKVDGNIEVRSPCSSNEAAGACWHVECKVPVQAGSHTIELVFGIHPTLAPFTRSFFFGERLCAIRELAR